MSRFRQIFHHLVSRDHLVLLAMLGAVLAIYAPVLNGQFIWDDGYLVGENPFFRSPVFSLEVFRHYLYVDSQVAYYRPVQNLSYILDYWVWGDNPFGYHLSNLFLHGIGAFFLFLLLKRILPSLIRSDSPGEPAEFAVGIAFCVALVWAVHPTHNAAVAYISGRADSLIAFFALSAWLLFLGSEAGPVWVRWPLRGLALISSLLALCSKEAGLIWMLLFLVWFFGFTNWSYSDPASQGSETLARTRFNRMRIGVLLACLLVLAGYWWLHHLPGTRTAVNQDSIEPFSRRLLLMLKAMWDYTGLIFWPAHLHMERTLGRRGHYLDFNAWIHNLRHEYQAVLGAIAFAIMIIGAFKKCPGQKLRVFGMIWFLIGFLPISNLIPLNAQAAEHWIYMPSIGFILFLAGLLVAMPAGQPQIAALILAATVPLGIRTAYRSAEWVDPQKFFNQTEGAGSVSPRIYLNLSNLATVRGDLGLGERMLRTTLTQFPNYTFARINLGINLLNQKDPKKEEEAAKLLTLDLESLKRASKEFSYGWTAPLNLARLRVSQNRQPEALSILDEAMEVFPEIWELVAYKSQLLQQSQGTSAAIPAVQKYVDSRWWHYGASLLLGDLRAANGETNAAMAAWSNASTLDIRNTQAFIRMARFSYAHNQFQNALEAQLKAIDRDPDQPRNFLLLATILDELHRPADSQAAISRAEELRKRVKP